MRILANACCAASPADDGEPISDDWLRIVGEEATGGGCYLSGKRFQFYDGKVWVCGVFGRITPIAKPQTRGQFRALCAALGIPLTTPSGVTAGGEHNERMGG